MLRELLDAWPLLRQLCTGADGTGAEAMSRRTRELRSRTRDASVARSVCPYCAVGCGQLVYHQDGKLVDIEGDPRARSTRARCARRARPAPALTQPDRVTKVLYRRRARTEWEELDLEQAMDMIAERVWIARAQLRRGPGRARPAHTTAIAHLGGATLDNEENYLIKKLLHRRARDGGDLEPGAHMTLHHGPRSGDLAGRGGATDASRTSRTPTAS